VTRIKMCGMTDVKLALTAAEVGADYLGLVFAASRRQVTLAKAGEISRALSELKPRPQLVGVFAGSPATEVNRIAESCRLDRIQLSGGESWDYCLQIGHPLIKVIHITPGMTAGEVTAMIDEGVRILKNRDVLFLLDTGTSQAFGGTGQVFDWAIAREAAVKYPVMIAGGLTPDNVRELIHRVHPLGVDVSGGIESGGSKDPAKIQAFIRMVKQADNSQETRSKP